MATFDQLPAFPGSDFEPKAPPKDAGWLCTRCGSDRVLGISSIDSASKYAIAARCADCHKTNVMVKRERKPETEITGWNCPG